MFSNKTSYQTLCTVFLTASLAAPLTVAGDGKHRGERRGPPPEATAACADLQEGASCAFTGKRGDVTGLCITTGKSDTLACAPDGHPARQLREGRKTVE